MKLSIIVELDFPSIEVISSDQKREVAKKTQTFVDEFELWSEKTDKRVSPDDTSIRVRQVSSEMLKYREQYIKSTFSEAAFDLWNDASVRSREAALEKLLKIAQEFPEWPESLNETLQAWEEEKGLRFLGMGRKRTPMIG